MKRSLAQPHPFPKSNPRCAICRSSICSSTRRPSCWNLALRSGLKVFTTMLEEDRTAICGPRYAHEPERPACRAGTTPSEVVLGRPEGRHPAAARARRRPARSRCRRSRRWPTTDPLESPRRRADAGGRGHAAVRAQPGAASARDDAEPGHEQERRQPPLRREDDGAARGLAERAARRASTSSRC